ncbi:MAG TPA: GrpB family protein [Pyrinomonadaceae bacterium]|jgi:GrpB-like predicted nucleotidyltransferase (UPF0157 family)
MLGLERGIVKLLPHDERWHELFAEEKARISDVVGDFVVSIEHIGSTSVCGLAAKPILDIAIAIEDKASGKHCVAPLENIGYVYRGENGIPGRFYFVKGKAERRTHHLHVLLEGSEELKNHLAFRDHLRTNRDAAAEYDRIKTELAEKYPHDRDSYLDGKTEFIEKILKAAR